VQSTALSQIGIELQEMYHVLVINALKKNGKVHWLLDKDLYIFEKKDVEAGIMPPHVGMMPIFVLKLARSDKLAPTLPPPFTIVFQGKQIPRHPRFALSGAYAA
jgi:hypothetical protein